MHYAAFKERKFESLFYKFNTCLQKTTTCVGLHAEQIFPVNINIYIYIYIYKFWTWFLWGFFYVSPEDPGSCDKKIFK